MNKRDFLARLLGISAVAVVAKVEAKEEKPPVVATPIPDPGLYEFNGTATYTTTFNPYWESKYMEGTKDEITFKVMKNKHLDGAILI